jgi:hypothetical protein
MFFQKGGAVSEISPVFKASPNLDPSFTVAAAFGLKGGQL